MAHDRISVDIARFTPPYEDEDRRMVKDVGVSHLEEQFREGFGDDIPLDERARQLGSSLFESLATLSTDKGYVRLARSEPLDWLPYWLRLARPVVQDTRLVGGYVERQISDRERHTLAERPPDNDLTFMLGLFHISSIVVASELGIDHPALEPKPRLAIERPGASGQPGQAADIRRQRETLETFERLLSPRSSDRQKLINVRRQGARIVANSSGFIERLAALARADEAEAEE